MREVPDVGRARDFGVIPVTADAESERGKGEQKGENREDEAQLGEAMRSGHGGSLAESQLGSSGTA